MKLKIFFLTIIFVLSPVGLVLAQNLGLFDYEIPELDLFNLNSGLPEGIIEQISVDILPKVPNPGDQVNISVQSYSSNFDKAYFTWNANGQVIEKGIGKRSINFLAPESGNTITINLTIQKQEGGVITRSFTFAPADVDIIYEADTYTPPFYKGKALFTSESIVRFIAMPYFIQNGNTINPNNLVYTWSINGTVDQNNSGYGKRVYQGKSSLVGRPLEVEVEVSAINSPLIAKNSVFVQNSEPELIIYENNPLLGVVFEKAIAGNFLLDRAEIELQSVPYFFSTTVKDDGFVDYIWKMNGNSIEAGSRTSSIRLRNETGEEGRSLISLEAEHFTNILQIATQSIDLNFTEHNNVLEENFEF